MEIFNGTMPMIDCRPVSLPVCTLPAKLLVGHFTKVILFAKRGAPTRRPSQLTI